MRERALHVLHTLSFHQMVEVRRIPQPRDVFHIPLAMSTVYAMHCAESMKALLASHSMQQMQGAIYVAQTLWGYKKKV